MHKIFLLLVMMTLLTSCGLYIPTIGIPNYKCIVPECSGRITDLNGKPLKGVRIRIISYGKMESAYSDAEGSFKLKPLYKWVYPQLKIVNMYEEQDLLEVEQPTIAGFPSKFFGELGFFFESEKESFVVITQNYFPALYDVCPNLFTPETWRRQNAFQYCRQVKEKKKYIPTKRTRNIGKSYYIPEPLFYPTENPLDHKLYFFDKTIRFPSVSGKLCQLQTESTIVYFNESFLTWLFRPIREKVCIPPNESFGVISFGNSFLRFLYKFL